MYYLKIIEELVLYSVGEDPELLLSLSLSISSMTLVVVNFVAPLLQPCQVLTSDIQLSFLCVD